MKHESIFPLSGLSEGEDARIHALHLSGSIRRRLQDLGLVAGTRVTCIQRAAAGRPDRLPDPRRGDRAAAGGRGAHRSRGRALRAASSAPGDRPCGQPQRR